MTALVWLLGMRLKNRVWRAVKRLREPKFFIGMAVAAGYFLSLAFVRDFSGNPVGYLAHTFTAFLVFAHLRAWVPFPRQPRGPALFKLSDVHLLFPAPLSRPALLIYAVADKLPGAILFGLFFFFLSGFQVGALVGFACFTLLMTLHGTIATFYRVYIYKDVARGLLLFAPGWIYALALLAGFALAWQPLPAGGEGIFEHVGRLVQTPGLREISYPVRAPALLMLGEGGTLPLLVCLAQVGLYLLWLVRLDVHFEEWAVRRAEDLARRKARKGPVKSADAGRWSPFSPGLFGGRSVVAGFFWVRWLGKSRPRRSRSFLIGLAVVLAVGWAAPRLPEPWLRAIAESLPFVLEMVVILVLFWRRGSNVAVLDAMELLKPLPLRGWQVILGDVAGAAASGMYPVLGLLGLGVALTPQASYQPFTLLERLGMAGGLAGMLFTMFCGFHAILYIQALWFPGLAKLRTGQEGAVGHNMLVALVRMVFVVALFPVPCLLGFFTHATQMALWREAQVALPVGLAWLGFWAEILALVIYAGWLFDRADFLLAGEKPA